MLSFQAPPFPLPSAIIATNPQHLKIKCILIKLIQYMFSVFQNPKACQSTIFSDKNLISGEIQKSFNNHCRSKHFQSKFLKRFFQVNVKPNLLFKICKVFLPGNHLAFPGQKLFSQKKSPQIDSIHFLPFPKMQAHF